MNGEAALLMEMGTGKTLAAIAIAGRAWLNGHVRKLLVVAPKSVLPVWLEEFEKYADFDYNAAVLEGDAYKKVDILRHLISHTSLQVAIVNFESVWRLEDEIARWAADMIIVDESSRIKNPSAKQSRALHRLGKAAKYRLILTGTPVQNSPLDFFSQYKFLDEGIFGPSFYAFRARYAVMGGYSGRQVIGYKNLPELVEKAHSIAFRVTKEQALDLPETVDETRYVELEPAAAKIYKDLAEDSYAELLKGEITARNVLTQLLRLQQVTGGFIRDDEGGPAQKISNAKLQALEEIIDDVLSAGKKLVVFARFLPEIEAIGAMLRKKGIGLSCITGQVKDRGEAVRRFQEDDECRVFVAQLQTAGLGITLTAADTAVFYSLDFNLANYAQSKARIHRIGQASKCTYIHLVAKGTVDEKVLKALQRKEDVARMLVDDWRELFKKGGEAHGK